MTTGLNHRTRGDYTFYEGRLDSGLRVLFEPVDHVRSVTMGVWVETGSIHERPSEAGLTHFIEHLVFKGTKNRSRQAIAEVIDGVGGHLNAFTAKEYTCFYAQVLDEQLELAADVLADLVQNPVFNEDLIQREKDVVLEEIRMYEDTPDDLAHLKLREILWPDDPLGRPVVGYDKTVSGFERTDVVDYHRRRYEPGRIVVAVTGHVDVEKAWAVLSERFSGWRRPAVGAGQEAGQETVDAGDHAPDQAVLKTGEEAGRRTAVVEKETEQVHLCIGWHAFPRTDERRYPLLVFNTLLGGGSASRLFQEIREERGLAYHVYAFQSVYGTTGLTGVYTATASGNEAAVIEIIQSQLDQLRRKKIDHGELARAKEKLKGQTMLSLESTASRMTRWGKDMLLTGEIEPPNLILENIERVTADDVYRVVNDLFVPEQARTAAVGPVKANTGFSFEGDQ